MKQTKEVKKSLDPVTVAMVTAMAVVAYPGAKELVKDVKKIIKKDKEENYVDPKIQEVWAILDVGPN